MTDNLTPEQFEVALRAVGGRSDEAVLRRLGLSRAGRAEGQHWLDRLRSARELRDRIRGHFSGDPALILDRDEQQQAIEQAVVGPAPWLGMELLSDGSDEDVKAWVAHGLMDRVSADIPDGSFVPQADVGILSAGSN